MQTIKITVTSESPTNIILKERKPKEEDVTRKIAELLKKSNDTKEGRNF